MRAYNAHVRSASAGVSHSVRPIRASLLFPPRTANRTPCRCIVSDCLYSSQPIRPDPPSQTAYRPPGPTDTANYQPPKARRQASLWRRYGSGNRQLVVPVLTWYPFPAGLSSAPSPSPSPEDRKDIDGSGVVGGTWSGRQITTAYWSVPSMEMSTAAGISYVHTRGCKQFPWSHRSGEANETWEKGYADWLRTRSLGFFFLDAYPIGLLALVPSPPPSSRLHVCMWKPPRSGMYDLTPRLSRRELVQGGPEVAKTRPSHVVGP